MDEDKANFEGGQVEIDENQKAYNDPIQPISGKQIVECIQVNKNFF